MMTPKNEVHTQDKQAEDPISPDILDEPTDYRNAHICQRCREADWGIGTRGHCGHCRCCKPE